MADQSRRKRVLYVVNSFGQASETYISTEAKTLQEHFDVAIVALHDPDYHCEEYLPYTKISDFDALKAYAEGFAPDIIHTHWIFDHLQVVYRLAKVLHVPFTVRSHSFDVLWRSAPIKRRIKWYFKYRRLVPLLNDPLCIGVLCFPFAVELLKRSGVASVKLTASYPVMDYALFHDESPNGSGVLNFGAGVNKKGYDNYFKLAASLPDVGFDIYSIGYETKTYQELNAAMGSPVDFRTPVEHSQMPAVFKAHGWLVYTVDMADPLVGWPIAVAEAQASGTGVCMPNIRPDIAAYVAEAGIVYDSVDELVDIVSGPVPETLRQKGFEQAKKSDVREHIHLLTDIWEAHWEK